MGRVKSEGSGPPIGRQDSYRDAVASLLKSESQWHEDRAEGWPEDSPEHLRHWRSASALLRAAEYVWGGFTEEPIELVVDFVTLLKKESHGTLSARDVEPDKIIRRGAREVVRGFFFDDETRRVTERDVILLLDEVFRVTLESWYDHLVTTGEITSALASYFEGSGVYVGWEVEDEPPVLQDSKDRR